jgi:hypothetical protein
MPSLSATIDVGGGSSVSFRDSLYPWKTRPYIESEGCQAGLPEIVRALKSFSARQINNVRNTTGEAVWQRNYYEHIIRTEQEWERIQKYIEYNPMQWPDDPENPANVRDLKQ